MSDPATGHEQLVFVATLRRLSCFPGNRAVSVELALWTSLSCPCDHGMTLSAVVSER